MPARSVPSRLVYANSDERELKARLSLEEEPYHAIEHGELCLFGRPVPVAAFKPGRPRPINDIP